MSGPLTGPRTASLVLRRISTAAVLIPPAILYFLTLYPGVGGRGNTGDSAKFQYIGEVLGVPHQPGYPQYVVLNFLWTRLPLPGELATRVNLLSAVFALAAGIFLYLFFRELSGRAVFAALATWTVLLARTVWSYSTEAEVYSLHLLWVAAVSWAAIRFARDRTDKRLVVLLALYALSFGNHPMMITLLPGLAVLLFGLDGRRMLRRRIVTITLVAVTVSLAQYGYVLWRSHSDAPFVEGIGREADLERLADSMSGDRFTSKNLLRQGESELLERLSGIPIETTTQLGPIVALAGLWGVWVAFRKREALRWYLVLGILGPAAFIAAYHIGDWESYLTPAWVMLAGLAAVALGHGVKNAKLATLAVVAWGLMLALLGVINFRQLRIEENENDRSLLVAAAGQDAHVVAYRGPGYKSKQLNNYYRFGLDLEESRNLHFLTAKQAFEEEFAFLDDRPLYFTDKKVKRYFDRFKVDYVQRWVNQDPLSNYFVTGTRWPIDRLWVERSAESGTLVIRSSDEHVLSEELVPIEIVVVDGGTRRTRGIARFSFSDAWFEDPKQPGLLAFLDKIRPGDWVMMTIQGSAIRVNQATLLEMLTRLGTVTLEDVGPSNALVVTGRKGPNGSFTVVSDPVEPITLSLRPEKISS